MIRSIIKSIYRKIFPRRGYEIDPDEILIDSKNLPEFNIQQFEGRITKPISLRTMISLGVIFFFILSGYFLKVFNLQIVNGAKYFDISENNRLHSSPIFAERGAIFDRNGDKIVWNEKGDENLWKRSYATTTGLAHLIGFVKYPSKDKNGFYYRNDYEGVDGIEKIFNERLKGKNGLRIIEVDAVEKIVSQNMIEPSLSGENLVLSIDSYLSDRIYKEIKDLAERTGYEAGAVAIMDINSGEMLASVSYPEYDSQIMTDGDNSAMIKNYLNNPSKPFMNKITDGVYTPGSIVKLFMALGALNENIIFPDEKILSTGSIEIPNEYDPTKKSIFKDWKAHGYVDMRQAIAVSSNVYFYVVGGGYKDKKGLGISRIEKYFRLFGFGESVESELFSGSSGIIPSPEWKKKNFDNDIWRIGDTYHTSIGQYGFQVTPIQVVRAVATIANNGKLLVPSIEKGVQGKLERKVEISDEHFKVVREGMRMAVKEGTAKPVDFPFVSVGAKSGTAEVGLTKQKVNSWITGFFPFENPKYAFVAIMEKGPSTNTLGAGYVMRQVIDWMHVYTPQYLK